MTDDELQQYWDARPASAERIEECFLLDLPPETIVSESGESLAAVRWLYQQFRGPDAEPQG